jgi:hypothetical protein
MNLKLIKFIQDLAESRALGSKNVECGLASAERNNHEGSKPEKCMKIL